jgi:hypothetical protein
MNLRVGFELVFACTQRTPMLLMLNTHSSHVNDVIVPDRLRIDRALPLTQYHDSFGNLCSRIVTPPDGYLTVSTEALLRVSEHPEVPGPDNYQSQVEYLPDDCMQFLLGSRYCETDLLSNMAWAMFSGTPLGRPRVQAICNYACIAISTLTINRRAPPERRSRPIEKESACAGIMRTWRSRSVGQ